MIFQDGLVRNPCSVLVQVQLGEHATSGTGVVSITEYLSNEMWEVREATLPAFGKLGDYFLTLRVQD